MEGENNTSEWQDSMEMSAPEPEATASPSTMMAEPSEEPPAAQYETVMGGMGLPEEVPTLVKKRSVWNRMKKKVKSGTRKIQKGTLTLSRSFSKRSLGSSRRLRESDLSTSGEFDEEPEFQKSASTQLESVTDTYDQDRLAKPDVGTAVGNEETAPYAAPTNVSNIPPKEKEESKIMEFAAALTEDLEAVRKETTTAVKETTESLVPKDVQASVKETVETVSKVVEEETTPTAEEPQEVPSPLDSSTNWPTPAESTMAREEEILEEVQELIKSGALKNAYSAENAENLPENVQSYIPIIDVTNGKIRVTVDREMTPENHVSMIWIQDAYGRPLAAQKYFSPTEEDKASPVLELPIANIPSSVTESTLDVNAYTQCNKGNIWSAKSKQVAREEVVHGKAKDKLVATFFVTLPVLLVLIAVLLNPSAFLAGPDVAGVPTVDGWTVLENRGGISTSSKKVEGSPFLGFRGEAVIDMHISKLMTVYMNTTDAVNWVKDLKYLTIDYPTNEQRSACQRHSACAVYVQEYHMPWPVGNRDFVMLRSVSIDSKKKTVSGMYHSVEDERFPETPGVVRAHSERTYWNFHTEEDGKTKIVLEAFVDPKGKLPARAVNMLSKGWPRQTIENLVKRAKVLDKEDSHYLNW